MPDIVAGVYGVDGHVPIYDPQQGWKMWSLSEIYLGEEGLGRYVPKVHDYVVVPLTFVVYIVDSIDTVTLVPVLREIRPANMSLTLNSTDVLFGVGPGEQAHQMRAYINTSKFPYSLHVDSLLRVGGSMVAYAKIFRGSVVDGRGEVVSRIFDNASNFVSENVPLELVAMDDHVNYSLKCVSECKCTTKLVDNEVLTIVFYRSDGIVVSKAQVLVENTDYVKALSQPTNYITHISLETGFMSSSVVDQIDFPLNFPKNSVVMEGVVHYSNAPPKRYPVNGNKFKLFGFDQLVSSIEGQTIKLVLSYTIGDDESCFANETSQGMYISKPYTLKVVNPNLSYSVKLMPYPVWDPATLKYKLRWWLTTMDRISITDVTHLVVLDSPENTLDMARYEDLQTFQVSINLQQVSGSYKPFMHTQKCNLRLLDGPPTAEKTAWLINNEAAQSSPYYGANLYATKVSDVSVYLAEKYQDIDAWLDQTYFYAKPLVNTASEPSAPVPTHFYTSYKGVKKLWPIDKWDDALDLGVNVTLTNNLIIEFVMNTSSGYVLLSVVEMPIVEPISPSSWGG